ncbi:MAG: Spy0128 family protein [Eggerthellaceae bacterium]|jgi:pilin isopeptide linkage protein
MKALSRPLSRILLSLILVVGLMPVAPTALAESGGAASSSTVTAKSAESAESADSASTAEAESATSADGKSSSTEQADDAEQVTGKSSTANKKARHAAPLRAEGAGDATDASLSVVWTQGSNATVSSDGSSIEFQPPKENGDGIAAKGKITFSVSQNKTYEAGSIKITLPLYLFKTRDGSNAGAQVKLAVPEAPNTSNATEFNYTVDKAAGTVTITNYEPFNSTVAFTCDFEYDVANNTYMNSNNCIYKIENGAEASIPWSGTVNGNSIDSGTLTAKYNSKVTVKYADKYKSGRYVRWQSDWGDRPAGITDDEYSYYLFNVEGGKTVNGMPFKFQFIDTPSDGGIPVVWKGTDDYKTDENGNSVTNWNKFSDSTYTTSWSAYAAHPDLEGSPGSTYGHESAASIVVAYPKSAEESGKQMKNTITYRLQGMDDTSVQEKSDTVKFKNDTVSFHYTGDLFAASKYANGADSIQGPLKMLNNGNETTEIQYTCATPYNQNTVGKYLMGYDLTKDENGNYGKKTWTAELIDDQLYLDGTLLEPGDYEISRIESSTVSHEKAVDNPDTGSYNLVFTNYNSKGGSDENNTAAFYYRTSPNGEWQLFKTATPGESINNMDLKGLGAIQVKWVAKTNEMGLHMSMTLGIRLKPTAHVKQIIAGQDSVKLTNVDSLRVLDSNNNIVNTTDDGDVSGSLKDKILTHDTAGGYDLPDGKYLQHASADHTLEGGGSNQQLTKKVNSKYNDAAKRQTTINYTLTQQMLWANSKSYISPEEYRQAMGGLEHEATFYDLLPEGMNYKEGSARVTLSGVVYSSTSSWGGKSQKIDDIQVTQEPNWRGSGRTMVIFRVSVPETEWVERAVSLSFSGIYPYDAADDFGISPENDAAVTSDLSLDNCYADSPSSPRGNKEALDNDTWSSYLSDLDGDGNTGTADAASAAYASVSVTASHLDAAQTGFSKAIKALEDTNYSMQTETYADGSYTYRLRYRPDEDSAAKGLVFYDTIENAYGSNEHWKGMLQSVDVAYMRSQGVDAKVYYSTAAGCDPRNNEGDRDLLDASKWSTTAPSDMSKVTAIAVDLTKKTDGSDFELQSGRTAVVFLNMTAPSDVVRYVKPNRVYAYNDAAVKAQIKHVAASNSAVNAQIRRVGDSGYSAASVLHSEATQIGLRVIYKNLTVSKAVTGTSADKTKDYTYDLTFSGLEPSTTYTFYKGTSASGTASGYTFASDAGGKATAQVKLSDAESLTVRLPQNAKYTVSEQGTDEMAPSYTITSGGETLAQGSETDTGAALSTGEQALSGDTAVAYTNENKATVDVPVKKTWNASSYGSATMPTVQVKLLANGSDTGKTITLDGTPDDVETTAWNATFEDLDKYDSDWNEITYSVEETTDLGAGWTKKVDGPSGTVKYWTVTNTYTVQPTTAAIPVAKVLAKGDDSYTAPDIAGEFEFTIKDDPSDQVDSPLPADKTVKCGASGATVSFGAITYTKPGTYKYLVTESGSMPGVANDEDASAGKAVTVTVKDNGDGTMTAAVSGADATAEQASEDTTFTNAYTPAPVSVAVPVTKALSYAEGLEPADIAGKFTFTLADDPSDQVESPLPDEPTVECGKDGEAVDFKAITYTKPGTYKYLVTESGEAGGISNDAAATSGKPVTVTVSDDGMGALTATVSGADGDAQRPDATTFTNTYATEPATAAIPVTKVLESDSPSGLPDITGRFAFTLSGEDGAPMPDGAGATVTNPGEHGGTARFGAITYTKPGTYTYKITESGKVGGVDNDPEATSGKAVTVTVSDDGAGRLHASITGADSAGGAESEDTTFTNRYTAPDGGNDSDGDSDGGTDHGETTMQRMGMPQTGDGAGMLALALGALAALGAVALVISAIRRSQE